ncbi:MAG: hypothetical protein WC730_00160 [Patescibacteria group bacterium]|jgi:hypothetical protein
MNRLYVLLAVLAIGLLGFISVYSVTSARARMRDAVRLSDVRQVQVGLELYANDHSAYPEATETTALGTSATFCLGDSGFGGTCIAGSETVYLEAIGNTPNAGLREKSTCGTESNAYCYRSDSENYQIQFELERSQTRMNLVRGLNCATPSGFESGGCDF